MKINIIMFVCSLLISGAAIAHSGGHGEATQLKQWQIEGQAPVKASLLSVRGEDIYLENVKGELLAVSLKDLSKEDQLFVAERVARIKALNSNITSHHDHSVSGTNILAILAVLISIGAIALVFKARNKPLISFCAGLLAITILYACSDEETKDMIDEVLGTPTPNDPDEMDLAFAPYSHVTTWSDDDYYYVESDGIANHQMMVNITAWIAQVPVPHDYSGANAWSIPLDPEYAEDPISIDDHFQRGAIAIAANGIPIFNPVNASGLISKEIGELDDFGGHSGRGDDYHYHAAPLHLEATSGTNPIAYALDGFAVYGSTEPDGSAMEDLDEYHGHTDGEGGYHYHGTDSYPYLIAAMRGEVTLEGDAPQDQITPQARAFPPRQGDPHPISSENLIITDLIENETQNGYLLKYTSNDVEGSVEYSWDENELFTFIFHDVDGTTTTETWQR